MSKSKQPADWQILAQYQDEPSQIKFLVEYAAVLFGGKAPEWLRTAATMRLDVLKTEFLAARAAAAALKQKQEPAPVVVVPAVPVVAPEPAAPAAG